MTSERTEVSKSPLPEIILVVQDARVVASQNIELGNVSAESAIAALLLEDEVTKVYVAGVNLYLTLARLNRMMQGSVPGWSMRITNRRRTAYLGDGRQMVGGQFFVDYLSIDRKIGSGKSKQSIRKKRKRIDIMNLEMFVARPSTIPIEQLQMAQAILNVCRERGVSYRGTRGGIGGALLKKSPYWEQDRKPATRFINEASRASLPGNFYSVSPKYKKEGEFSAPIPHCYYVDQSNAHHAIAAAVPLPHPHEIRARGNYNLALKGEFRTWTRADRPAGEEILNEHMGLVLVKLECDMIPPTQAHLYPPWAKRGQHHVWLWTPEYRLIQADRRLRVDTIIAAFTATKRDPVLAEYGEWALDHIGKNPGDRKYTKPVLLAAYGMLAFNPGERSIYRYWGGPGHRGNKVEIPEGGLVSERRLRIPQGVQYTVVNVIARGMIEAETRARTLEYAKELHVLGFHVAQIYADGILIETDAMPFMPSGWRVSHSLTNVSIPRPNAILSDQLTKLPGVARSEDDIRFMDIREKARRRIVAQSSVLIPS